MTFPGASYDAWKTTEPDSDEHEATCIYCPAPASITSAIGLDGDYSEPNAIGQREYIAPRAERRCEECQESFERVAKREQRLAQEGWI